MLHCQNGEPPNSHRETKIAVTRRFSSLAGMMRATYKICKVTMFLFLALSHALFDSRRLSFPPVGEDDYDYVDPVPVTAPGGGYAPIPHGKFESLPPPGTAAASTHSGNQT